MFEEKALDRAVSLQQRGHRLMRWLQTGLDSNLLSFDETHATLALEGAARAWMLRNYDALPAACRPSVEDVPAFANLFASYLVTSFDLLADRPTRNTSRGWCSCDLCSYVVSLSHLQPKKIAPVDKTRARRLELRTLAALANELDVVLDDASANRLADDDALREPLALVTYGHQLEQRLLGNFEGPEILVVWRRFAWTRAGSPKKDFTLSADAIREAEAQLVRAITEHRST